MKYPILLLLAILILCCSKDAKIDDILINFKISSKEVLADGKSTIPLSVELSKASSEDRRSVVFVASSGMFTESGSNRYAVKPAFENAVLVARANFRAPTSPGDIQLKVKPEYDDPLQEYERIETIVAKPSLPSKLSLQTSSFGIASNHLNEVLLTGKLSNNNGGFVSTGYKVLFEDFLLNNSPANGQFRVLQSETADSSFVKTYYSAFAHSIATQFKIRAILLDSDGQKTSITDSIIITVNQ